jgi:hypothetical protein
MIQGSDIGAWFNPRQEAARIKMCVKVGPPSISIGEKSGRTKKETKHVQIHSLLTPKARSRKKPNNHVLHRTRRVISSKTT